LVIGRIAIALTTITDFRSIELGSIEQVSQPQER
jgi:uncharacterized membrane protein